MTDAAFECRRQAKAYDTLASTLEKTAQASEGQLALHLIGAAYSLRDAVKHLTEQAEAHDANR